MRAGAQAVDAVMERLSEALGLDGRMCGLAHLCAVYHDIGRFEQLRRYDTFLDHLSVDHAQMGCEVLRSGGFLDGLPEKDRQMVLKAIANHNRLTVEGGLDEETLLLCRMLRDADKCDIFRVFATEDPRNTTGVCAEEAGQEKISDAVYESLMAHRCIFRVFATEDPRNTTGVCAEEAGQEKISDAVYESLMAHRCVKKEERVSGLDIWVSFLGFLYDLNFPESLRIVRETSYYKKPFETLKIEDGETHIRMENIFAEAEAYMDEMERDWRKDR